MKTWVAIICSFVWINTTGQSQTFINAADEWGIDFAPVPTDYMGGGLAIFDYNNDGLEDLYITGGQLTDRLYKNVGGSFVDVTFEAGLMYTGDRNTLGVIAGDIDRDGDKDLFVTTWRENMGPNYMPNYLLRNNGDGTFTNIASSAGLDFQGWSYSSSFIDVNKDGWLDIYVGNYIETVGFINEGGEIVGFDHECFDDLLYLNNGDLTFTEVGEEYGLNNNGCSLAMAATDHDNDGDQDLMVANDFGEFIFPNKLYSNQFPDAGFEDISEAMNADVGMYGMGVAVGDYNEDGFFDYYITNMGRNSLLRYHPSGYVDVSDLLGISNTGYNGLLYTSWGTFFLDYDNDTDLDLFVANGHMPSFDFIANYVDDPNKLYANNGDGQFTDVSSFEGIAETSMARGAAKGDFDNDGDYEIVVVNLQNDIIDNDEKVLFFENQGNANHWVGMDLKGTMSDLDGIGSIVRVYAGDRMWMQEVSGGGDSHASHSSDRLVVGLGEINAIDSLVVEWPVSGSETWYNVAIDSYNTLLEGFANHVDEKENTASLNVYPMPFADVFKLSIPTSKAQWNMQLIAINGEIVMDREVKRNAGIMEVQVPHNLPEGMYVIRLQSLNKSITERVIHMR